MRVTFLLAVVTAIAVGGPAASQTPDFGDDSGDWANDGECDDPRFEGEGMTTTPLLEEDTRADATDCRAAWEAGTIRLRDAAGRGPRQSWRDIPLGDDSGEWAEDGECDDRRFTGDGMAASLNWENAGRDASDCRAGLENGTLDLWDFGAAVAATNCPFLDFGDDAGDFAEDGKCDDPRFEGWGTDSVMVPGDARRDASDCRRLCDLGVIGLRDYRAY